MWKPYVSILHFAPKKLYIKQSKVTSLLKMLLCEVQGLYLSLVTDSILEG